MVVARPDGYQADAVARMLIERMGQLPTHPRRSLTGDRGREMADHGVILAALSMPVFFCGPRHPWRHRQVIWECLSRSRCEWMGWPTVMADGVFQTAAAVMIWFQTAKRLVSSVRHSGALIR